MNFKRFLKITTVASILVLAGGILGGCGSTGLSNGSGSSDKVTKKAPKNLKIGVSVSTLTNPAFVNLKNVISNYAKKHGSKVIVDDANNDTSKQNNDVEDLITQRVDALIINQCDSSAISAVVKKANEANIPVVCVDRSADSGKVISTVASDNVAGGKMAANWLVKTLGENAKVAEIQGIPGASATRERGKGFDSIGDKKLDIVTKQTAQFDRAKALTVTENILQAHRNIKGIFAQNDEEAVGAARAVKAANKKITIIGFDGALACLNLIQKGQITATVGQQWNKIGQQSVQMVYDYYQNKKVPKNDKVPVKIITKKNVSEFKKQVYDK
ncbi:substrate-binding domain-containing protein [Lactobacillus acidophilus]|uniref:substrate-binding domain-containing protein n=1 Tax=Lactobacillus acidophilus TaxID=1579 RepID=UPI001969CA69|nr:substrate-binding domain-containing protein [Lactobacillus acidophilus]MBN3484540.1 D-ribose ABC transporter substrate-binding protein [Lactobacillus acidophilus]